MSKRTTNLIGLIITILAGTYFYIMYCSECRRSNGIVFQKVERAKEIQKNEGAEFKKVTLHYYAQNNTNQEQYIGHSLPTFHEDIVPIYFALQN